MKTRVLFLCTANSARSQIAEALLRHQAGDRFEVCSAGTQPDEVDPRAVEALQAFGIGADGLRSKSIDSLAQQHFDFVITLCSKARQECQNWPGSGVVMAWDFDDPKSSADPRAFVKTLHAINKRIQLFVEVNSKATGELFTGLSPLEFYKALADEVRLKSLLLIQQEGELCVCELMEALGQPQPKISRHLAQLRRSGLLLDRRQGQWVYYRLHPLMSDWMREVLRLTQAHNPEQLATATARLAAMSARPSAGGQACMSAAV